MKYCPDPNCPGALGPSRPSEYRDDIVHCPECGSSLSAEAPVSRTASQPGTGVRILVSTVAFAFLCWLQYVPLPGLGEIEWVELPVGGAAALVVLPHSYPLILGMFVLVEFAAWAIPGWRNLRRSGVAERRKLDRVTLYLSVGLGAAQTLGLAMYLRPTGEPGAWTPLLWLVSGAAATCAVFAVVHLVERHGLGKGWSILVLVLCFDGIWTEISFSKEQVSGLVVLVGAIALVLTVTTVWYLGANTRERSKWLPLPTAGLVPLLAPCLLITNFIIGAIELYGSRDRNFELTPRDLLLRVVIVLIFGVFCHHVYFGDVARGHRSEIGRRSLIASLVFLVVITTAEHVLNAQNVYLFLPTWIILVAIVWDLFRESRFRRKHGDLVSVRQLNRLAELPRAVAALDSASIPAITPGQGHRSMLHFFAPYVQIDILVPADCEEAARESLATPHSPFIGSARGADG